MPREDDSSLRPTALTPASPHPRIPASFLSLVSLLVLVAAGAPPAAGAEYRDSQGRFVLTLPDGFQEVPRPLLQARVEGLRRGGVSVPAYEAAFDRGREPRFSYPYALLEVAPVPGAAWTTADLEGTLGRMDTEHAARETAATFERLGLGNLLRDPRITFVRWEPERQAGVYRIATQARGADVLGTGRIYFYRAGYITLWFYYLADTPYAEAADRFTAALTVLAAYRVPPAGFLVRARTFVIAVIVLAAAGVVGVIIWLARWRRPPSLTVLLLGLSFASGAGALGSSWAVEPGSLYRTPSEYGAVSCY